MPMFTLSIDINALGVEAAVQDRLDDLAQGVREQTLFVQSVWGAAVMGHLLPGMTREIHDQKYAESVTDAGSIEYPWNSDPWAGRVVATDGERAERVENGYPSFDMKIGLLAGPHSRPTKSGGRVNVVPFSHASPGAYTGQKGSSLPAAIYGLASALHNRERVKLPGELSGWGMRSKLKVGAMQHPYSWKSSPFSGMVRSHQPGSTSYSTFRAVSDKSDPSSWWNPGLSGNPVVESVKNYCEPLVLAALGRIARGEA